MRRRRGRWGKMVVVEADAVPERPAPAATPRPPINAFLDTFLRSRGSTGIVKLGAVRLDVNYGRVILRVQPGYRQRNRSGCGGVGDAGD